jgi:hypothetical protein
MPDDQQQNPSVNSDGANLPLDSAGNASTPQITSDVTPISSSAADVPYSGQDLTSPFDGQEPLPTGAAPVEVSATDSGAPAIETAVAPSETGGEVPIPPEGVDLPNEGETPTVITPQASTGVEQTTVTDGMTTPPVISPSEQPNADQNTEQLQ